MSHREKQLKKSAVRVVESDLGVIDLPYLLLTLLLVAIGLLVLFSASYARAYYETKNAASVFVNQLIFAVMGIGVMWLISRVPYEWYQKLALLILAVSIGLLVLVPVIGTESGGATRWLVLRTGADLRLRCTGCGREVMLPRKKAEKALKKIISPADQAGEDRRNPYAL